MFKYEGALKTLCIKRFCMSHKQCGAIYASAEGASEKILRYLIARSTKKCLFGPKFYKKCAKHAHALLSDPSGSKRLPSGTRVFGHASRGDIKWDSCKHRRRERELSRHCVQIQGKGLSAPPFSLKCVSKQLCFKSPAK